MTGEIFDYPTRLIVVSETDSEESYLVDLGRWPIYKTDKGVQVYNGSCGAGAGIGCKDFRYRCEPMLKKIANAGKVFRCKHIRWARENVLDYLIEHCVNNDPNHDENVTT